MFKLLSKKFVKDYKNYKDFKVRLEIISLSGMVGIFINFLLFLVKIIIGIILHSQAIIADAFNNMTDALTSIITTVGAKASNKPADRMHPWGHGRSEYIASFIVSLVIMLVGISLFKSSVTSFLEKNIPVVSINSIIILTITLGFKIYIYYLNDGLEKKLKSELNKAVKIDARNDIISTVSIILAMIIQQNTEFNIDAVIGLVLSIIVFLPGLRLYKDTINRLLGKRIDKELEEKIGEVILSASFVIGYHNLQIHEYGPGKLIGSCDVEVPENISVGVMHESISYIEETLRQKLGIDITCHMDPTYSLVYNETNKEKLERLGHSTKYGNRDLQNR